MSKHGWVGLATMLAVSFAGCSSEQKRDERLRDFATATPTSQAGISQDNASNREIPEEPLDPNVIRPGFTLHIRGLDDQTLNGVFHVTFNGHVDLPYSVAIQAGGMTLDDFKKAVTQAYASYYKNGARFEAAIVERKYMIEVRGLVLHPGRYNVKKDSNLDEVITLAGGFNASPESRPNFVKLTRGDRNQVIDLAEYYNTGNPTHLTAWRGGETLFFQKESRGDSNDSLVPPGKIRILGEVRNPGPQTYREGADVFYYLSEANGPTAASDLDKIQVVRGSPGQEKIVEFELNEIKAMPALKAGDIVIFHADKTTVFQRVIAIAGATASILGTVALFIIAV